VTTDLTVICFVHGGTLVVLNASSPFTLPSSSMSRDLTKTQCNQCYVHFLSPLQMNGDFGVVCECACLCSNGKSIESSIFYLLQVLIRESRGYHMWIINLLFWEVFITEITLSRGQNIPCTVVFLFREELLQLNIQQ